MHRTDLTALVQLQQPRQPLHDLGGLHQPGLRIIRRPPQLTHHLIARPVMRILWIVNRSEEPFAARLHPRLKRRQLSKHIELLITRARCRIHSQQPLDLPRHNPNTTTRV